MACLLQGLRSGFRIGFDYRAHKVKVRPGNLKSALDNPGPVEEYLHKELQMGRVQELPVLVSNKVHTSKFGVIPKSNQPGKWRLILDLSSPSGASVNDGISKDLCSMHYATLDEALAVIVDLGPGALLAKIDIKEAYRNIPVHPDDRPLLGMAWGGRTYIDCQLPFGLRSAPLLFSVVADVLEWIVLQKGVSFCMHYLDDFLTAGPAKTETCASNLKVLSETCQLLGPIKGRKSRRSRYFDGIPRDPVGHCQGNNVRSKGETGSLQTGSGVMATQESGTKTGSSL